MMNFTFPGPGKSYSLHNHSTFSDGASTIEDMCRAAKNAGLAVFGMSDHWVVPAYEGTGTETWRMKHERLGEYVETLQKLKAELDDENFTLKIGLEVDFFFENMDEIFSGLKPFPLDYLIGSVHCCGTFPVDHEAYDWEPLSQDERDEICEMYWKKMEGAAARKEFAFLGHLDLPKKFALIDNSRYIKHATRVLDILQKNGGAIELNTSGWFKPCKAPYPALDILKLANARNIPVIINADAHHADHVKRSFDEAEQLLNSAGYRF